ncbi:hypothetical protein FRC07_007674 [Ceratobasidium sp. 392]|nr:hypothetical protein FRC07_007674 [Ceratobasidium sp. 392]
MTTLSPAAAAALHQLEVAVAHGFASKCLSIAGICVLIYDHILTFPDEVRFIWKQKWSIVSTIFVLNRYITPLVLAVDVRPPSIPPYTALDEHQNRFTTKAD